MVMEFLITWILIILNQFHSTERAAKIAALIFFIVLFKNYNPDLISIEMAWSLQ